MASESLQVLALFGVERQKSHADLKRAVPGIGVCGGVSRAVELHLGGVAGEHGQGLGDGQFDICLLNAGQGA